MPYDELLKGRTSIAGQYYLTTAVTVNRRPFFQSLPIGKLVLDALQAQDAAGHVQTLACVVMPDHVHWLLRLGRSRSLSEVMQFKGQAAREINLIERRSGPLWQKGFHDHAMRTEESLEAAGRYLIENPIRAGLVDRLSDYPLWRCVWKVSG